MRNGQSLGWYRSEWKKAFGNAIPQQGLDELARLSYENQALRRRLAAVERCLWSMMGFSEREDEEDEEQRKDDFEA